VSAEAWRLITDDGVSAAFGLAADEQLALQVGQGASAPTLRLYTYRSHCALVGRFQNMPTELNRDFCAGAGIEVGRRPTGGGAILMGADQLGVALALPERRSARSYQRSRELFARLSSGLLRALGGLGVEAGFRRKNDLEVGGRKIAGLGVYFPPPGGLLFHASLLVDLDVPLMLKVLHTPLEKLADKAVATVAQRVTTLRRELGEDISVAEVRRRVARAYAEALEIDLHESRFSREELGAIHRLERDKYASQAWIDMAPLKPDLSASVQVKTEAGLLGVALTLAGETIKSVYITGDFFVDEEALGALESALRWHTSRREALYRTLTGLEEKGVCLAGVSTDVLVEALVGACEGAKPQRRGGTGRGCFVNP